MITEVTIFEDFDDFRENGGPGAICFMGLKRDEGLAFKCPCCSVEGYLPLKHDKHGPSWKWNGSREKPTLNPSILQKGPCGWHGWLKDGQWIK